MNLGHWDLQPLALAPVALYALAYRMRARQLLEKGRPVPAARAAAFYGGLIVVLLALISPLDYLGEHQRFSAHMAQHLLLGDIAPLLVVLGLTGPVLRPVLAIELGPAGTGARFIRWSHCRSGPSISTCGICRSSTRRRSPTTARARPRASLLLRRPGALMWAAVIEPLPGPTWFGNGPKAVYILVVRTLGAILANVFIWSGHPFYPYYVTRDRTAGLSPVSDQRAAGAIMFIEGSVVTLLAFAWLFIRFTRETEIRQRLLERDLDETQAARAARYGRSSRVRDVG